MSLAGAVVQQPAVQGALASALGSLASLPLVRASVRNWWVLLPVGYVAYDAYRQEKKRGNVSVSGIACAVSPVVMLAATLVMLNHCLASAPQQYPQATPPTPPATNPVSGLPKIDYTQAKDAAYTPSKP